MIVRQALPRALRAVPHPSDELLLPRGHSTVIVPERRAEIGFAEFRELCREHLSAADFATFQAVFEAARMPENLPFLHELAQRERQFRNAVVRARHRTAGTGCGAVAAGTRRL